MAPPRHAAPISRRLLAALRSPLFLALAAGTIAACGFQPLMLWPLTLAGVAILFALLRRASTVRSAFGLGWIFGLGHFTLGNNWIATAFTYQASMPIWLGGIAVFLLSLYLALFPALACALAAGLMPRLRALLRTGNDAVTLNRIGFALIFAACWIVTEWLRGWLFTGFPWNPIGIALLGGFHVQGLAMLTPWIGTYGLSGALVLISGLIALGLQAIRSCNGSQRLLYALPVLALAAGLGLVMTLPDTWSEHREGAIRFTLIQPDIRQEFIDDPRQFENNFVKMAQLSLPLEPGSKRVVFWPESGLGGYLRDGYPSYFYQMYTYAGDPDIARKRIGRVIGPYSLLLTGLVDLVMENGDDVAARNTITAFNGNGNILASYSKAHLVPFGEYLPMRDLLEPIGLSRLVPGTLDFWPGPGPRTIDLGAYGEAGMQICYEIVFSGEVVDPLNRPDYIFNPSTDGWFGGWGPPQHLAQARLRAMEEGLPVMRSTTTGISAVIDANGLVRKYLPWQTAGRIDGFIPPAHEPTLFARFGNALPLGFATVLLLLALCMVALEGRRS